MSNKNNVEKEQELVLMMLEQLSYITRYVNEAIFHGSTTSIIASYILENLMPHESEEQCEFEQSEIEDIFNSFKDANIQLKKMYSEVKIISEILLDFNNSLDELMVMTGIYVNKKGYVDATLLDNKNYYRKKDGDLDDK